MTPHVRLGRVLGIEIGLHYSWFLVALLIVLSLSSHFRAAHADWTALSVWVSALLTAAAFFATLVLHELSHALTARARGLPVGGITLFALGGVSRIQKEPADARTELLVGIVGPATSAVIGLVCLGLAAVLGWRPGVEPATPPAAVLSWLGYINFALAVFNLVPGYPLDGGRVLRAVVWAATGDAARATRTAATGGQLVAILFIVIGLLRFFSGAGVGGLWIAFIGWFLLSAAGATSLQVDARRRLAAVHAGDVMRRDCPVVAPGTSLQDVVDSEILQTGRRCFVVADEARALGLVTLHEIKKVSRDEWGRTPVRSAMRPLEDLRVVTPATPAMECLETMVAHDVHQLPVVDEGRLQGVVSRGDILRVLQAATELGVR
jgi:Zn-dependent protease/CBS domain-containing protein